MPSSSCFICEIRVQLRLIWKSLLICLLCIKCAVVTKYPSIVFPTLNTDPVPAGCTVDPVNYFRNEQNTSRLLPNKRDRESEDLSRYQKLQISLNYNVCQEEVDHSGSIPKQNPVSTGLRLSYDDDERNSSVTSANGSMADGSPSILLSFGYDIKTELDRQKEEFDHFIKVQAEHLAKGVRDLKQRHTSSFITIIKNGISKKLHEKEMELENMNRKNKELTERIKQVAAEARNWHYRAKYNESVVNFLKTNLHQQAMPQGVDQAKEGFGDSELDDAASYMDLNNYLCTIPGHGEPVSRGLNGHLVCKACRSREVSVLLMPCRHLCICKDCDGLICVCPICSGLKTASVEFYLS